MQILETMRERKSKLQEVRCTVHLPLFSKFHNPFFGERVPVTLKIPNLNFI